MSDRLGEFTGQYSRNFRVDANSGEIAELYEENTDEYEDSIDSFNPWER